MTSICAPLLNLSPIFGLRFGRPRPRDTLLRGARQRVRGEEQRPGAQAPGVEPLGQQLTQLLEDTVRSIVGQSQSQASNHVHRTVFRSDSTVSDPSQEPRKDRTR